MPGVSGLPPSLLTFRHLLLLPSSFRIPFIHALQQPTNKETRVCSGVKDRTRGVFTACGVRESFSKRESVGRFYLSFAPVNDLCKRFGAALLTELFDCLFSIRLVLRIVAANFASKS